MALRAVFDEMSNTWIKSTWRKKKRKKVHIFFFFFLLDRCSLSGQHRLNVLAGLLLYLCHLPTNIWCSQQQALWLDKMPHLTKFKLSFFSLTPWPSLPLPSFLSCVPWPIYFTFYMLFYYLFLCAVFTGLYCQGKTEQFSYIHGRKP